MDVKTTYGSPKEVVQGGQKVQADIRDFFPPATKHNTVNTLRPNNASHQLEEVNRHDHLFSSQGAPAHKRADSVSHAQPPIEPQTVFPERHVPLSQHDSRHDNLSSFQDRPHHPTIEMLSNRDTLIDFTLMPQPLNVNTAIVTERSSYLHQHSPLPLNDGHVLMSAALDTSGSFRKSRIMSLFEQQNLGTDTSSPTSSPDLGMTVALEALRMREAAHQEEEREGSEPVIYFLPTPSLISHSPTKVGTQNTDHGPDKPSEFSPLMNDKARRILGNNNNLSNHERSQSHVISQPLSTRPQLPPKVHTSKHRFGTSNPENIYHPLYSTKASTSTPDSARRKGSAFSDGAQSPSTSQHSTIASPISSFSSSTNSVDTTPKKRKAQKTGKKKSGRIGRLLRQYSNHMEGLQMIQ